VVRVVRISIEVDNGEDRFGLTVRAESIERALGIAEALHPGADVRVVFPIEPEGFFVEIPGATPGPVGREMAQVAQGVPG
jgi:hypothetical protein